MDKENKGRLVRLSALAAAVAAASAPAAAAEFVVTSKAPSGEGSLAAAIGNANEAGGIDTITFAVSGTIDLQSYGLPTINEGVSITGPGVGSLTIKGGTSEDAIFRADLSAGEAISISGMKVTNARYGAVEAFNGSEGQVNLSDMLVTSTGTAEEPAYDSMIDVNEGADLVMTNVDVKNVVAGSYSAVRASGEGTSIRIIESEISGNTTDLFAGGIRVSSDAFLYLENSVVKNNTSNNDGPGGVGIKYGASATIRGSQISGNRSDEVGGGIMVRSGASLDLNDSTVRDNTANYAGGGLYIESSEASITDSTIKGNRVLYMEESAGGGIYVNSGELGIYGTSLSNNRAGNGGGISARFTDVYMSDSLVSGNVAYNDGGGLDSGPVSDLYIESSAFVGNTAGAEEQGSGGAINASGFDSQLLMTQSTLRNNSASQYGGGIYTREVRVEIDRSRIVDNSADTGGGLYLESSKYLGIERTTISNNTASNAFGALMAEGKYSPGSYDIVLEDVTIADNRSGNGPAVSLQPASETDLDLWQTTISGNRGVNAPAVEIVGDDYARMDIFNSTLSGNVASGSRAAIAVSGIYSGEIGFSTFVDNKGAGSGTTQLHLAGDNSTDDPPYIEVSNSIFSSGNDDEVVIGGTELGDDASYGYDEDLTVFLIANIMSSGYAQVGESAEIGSSFGAIPTDPGLGPLADNGGYTRTHAPLSADSAGVNQGAWSRPDGTDQRDAAQNGDADLGAVEFVDNTPPRLIRNLSKPLSGVVGREVPPLDVLTAFVDDEGDNIFVGGVSGLPAGLSYDGECEDAICGELEAAGEYTVFVTVFDDGTPSLSRTVQAVVKVSETAAPPLFIDDDDDGGSVPFGLLALTGAMAWLRRRRG